MKRVICQNNSVSVVSDVFGRALHCQELKAPEKGRAYHVTGELNINGYVYYLLMGLGIKIAYRADKFKDCI